MPHINSPELGHSGLCLGFNRQTNTSTEGTNDTPPYRLVAVTSQITAEDQIAIKTGRAAFSAAGATPITVGRLLPAAQKVREAARTAMKVQPFAHRSTAGAAAPAPSRQPGTTHQTWGWGTYILPQLEQQNLLEFQDVVRGRRGGAIALAVGGIADGTSNTMMLQRIIGSQDLFEWIRLRSASGDFTAFLERALVRLDKGATNEPPLLVVAFSSSRSS